MTTPLDDIFDTDASFEPSRSDLQKATSFADGLERLSSTVAAEHIASHISMNDAIPLARIIRAGIEALSDES